MRLAFTFCALLFAGCGAMSKGSLENAACNTGCDEARDKCVAECAEEVDKSACEIACGEAKQKCQTECKN
ncbi:MAG: hypothetical protein AAFU77_14095 [Myxococcota bacterium]